MGLYDYTNMWHIIMYMAPEILQVDESTGKTTKSYSGHSVDIFAAGKILFVMVTGYFPFDIAVP